MGGVEGQARLGFPARGRRGRPAKTQGDFRGGAQKNAQSPHRPLPSRHVARSGLAMDNLKSDWNFPATSLDLAAKDDQFTLRVCAVDLKNEPLTAETLIKTNA